MAVEVRLADRGREWIVGVERGLGGAAGGEEALCVSLHCVLFDFHRPEDNVEVSACSLLKRPHRAACLLSPSLGNET